jgi:hypothetical protein
VCERNGLLYSDHETVTALEDHPQYQPRSATMRALESGIIAYSVVSCCFSLVVIATFMVFPTMRKGKLNIILNISISDFFMNVASSVGFPDDGTALCWIQGLTENYFALCSWFWTTLLAYRVYCTVRYSKPNISTGQMMLIGWGLPLLLTAIPLSTTNYGASQSNSQWCLFVQRRGSAEFWRPLWSYATFFAWLFMCVICMFAWQIIISLQFRKSSVRAVVNRTYDKVYLYPVVMVVCWMLNYWCDDIAPSSGETLNAVSMVFGISNGLLAAIIFMWKSEEAQRRWWLFLFPPEMSRLEQLVEPTVRLDFEDEDGQGEESMAFTESESDALDRYRLSNIGVGGTTLRSGDPTHMLRSVGTGTASLSFGPAPIRTASVAGAVSDVSMSDLTTSTAGSSPFHTL